MPTSYCAAVKPRIYMDEFILSFLCHISSFFFRSLVVIIWHYNDFPTHEKEERTRRRERQT
ncbi:hypothetical protein K504DRAFT_154666 [Pleomassaria siparia CBS 279.74]|uniref:Uncharacterized protein n=1 Tax=Pleomassaria siparia CBS 279.74 TaxID=1314801 RepID=A0A6G1KN91_9PLEO|nr:hypothetical protein K504DRAFT_154666 [Pleomassaria siparia CBS 279.74]